MARKSNNITVEEWRSELAKLTESTGTKGFTTRDAEEFLGCSTITARSRMREWFERGEIECLPKESWRETRTMDGKRQILPTYRMVKKRPQAP